MIDATFTDSIGALAAIDACLGRTAHEMFYNYAADHELAETMRDYARARDTFEDEWMVSEDDPLYFVESKVSDAGFVNAWVDENGNCEEDKIIPIWYGKHDCRLAILTQNKALSVLYRSIGQSIVADELAPDIGAHRLAELLWPNR